MGSADRAVREIVPPAKDQAMRKLLFSVVTMILAGCSADTPALPEAAQEYRDVADRLQFQGGDDAVPADRTDEADFRKRGNAMFAQGAFDQAIEDYTAAIKLKPTPAAYYNRGVAYSSKEQLDLALA